MGSGASKSISPLNLINERNIPRATQFLSESCVKELKDANITVILPDSQNYILNCIAWNYDVIQCPSAFIVPNSAAEVSTVMKIAVQNHLDIVVAAGRHSHVSLIHNAVVIDLQKLNSIEIDEKSLEAKLGGGLKLGEVDAALSKYGLATPVGTNIDTGIGGLILGGGFGFLSRLHGLSIDNLLSVEIVTVAGDIVIANKDNEHSDLFWGMKGAGPNFGIVTKFHLKLHKLSRVLSAANVYIPKSAILSYPGPYETAKLWRNYAKTNPNNTMTNLILPGGGPLVCAWTYIGSDLTEGRELYKSFKSISASPIKQLKEIPYSNTKDSLQQVALEHQQAGNFYEAGVMLQELSDDCLTVLLKYQQKPLVPNSKCQMLVFQLGGKVNEIAADDTAFGHRNLAFWVLILGSWPTPRTPELYQQERTKVKTWVKALVNDLKPFVVGGNYNTLGETEDNKKKEAIENKANDDNKEEKTATDVYEFPKEDAVTNTELFHGAENYKRLQLLKQKYDPNNFLKRNKNVKPVNTNSNENEKHNRQASVDEGAVSFHAEL